MIHILPKKFLPFLLALIATVPFFLTSVTPVMGDYAGIGSDTTMETYRQKSATAKNNYNILKAYSEYEKSPADTKTQEKLKQALTAAGYSSVTITDQPTDTTASINTATNGKDGYTQIPQDSTQLAQTLKTAEQTAQTSQKEYETILGERNSQDLQKSSAGTLNADVAASVRSYQDLERMQRLNCVRTSGASQPPASSLCEALIKEYNERCATLKGCTKITTATITQDEKSVPVADPASFEAARTAAIKKVQAIESEMQEKFKKTMLDQKLKVSEILTYKDSEGTKLQTDYIAKGGIVYFISRVVDSLVMAVSSLAVIALIIGGYMLITSGGDDQKRENGKSVIKYTIIGLLFVFGSYAIVSFIMGLFYSG